MAIRTTIRTIQSQVGTVILSLEARPTLGRADPYLQLPEPERTGGRTRMAPLPGGSSVCGIGAVEAISREAYPDLYCGYDSAERPTLPSLNRYPIDPSPAVPVGPRWGLEHKNRPQSRSATRSLY